MSLYKFLQPSPSYELCTVSPSKQAVYYVSPSYRLCTMFLYPHWPCTTFFYPHRLCTMFLRPHRLCTMFLYTHRLCTMFLHPHRLCTVSPSTHTGCIACFLLSFLLQLSNFRLNAFPQQIHILCFLYTVQKSCFPLSLLIFYRFITVFVLVLHSFSLW